MALWAVHCQSEMASNQCVQLQPLPHVYMVSFGYMLGAYALVLHLQTFYRFLSWPHECCSVGIRACNC